MSTLLGLGLVHTGVGSGRIPHVSAGAQRLEGLKCSSSPTSGTRDPLVRGDFALTCVQSLWWRPSDASARAVAWPPRWPIQVCGVAGSGSWLAGPPPTEGWVYAVPRSGSVGLVVGGQHQFMVLGCGHKMTSPTLARNSFWRAPLRGHGSRLCSVCPAKVGVDTVRSARFRSKVLSKPMSERRIEPHSDHAWFPP